MTTAQFLIRVRYSTARPEGISAPRWSGMLRWYATRQKEGSL